MAGYSKTPLIQKLGIKPGMRIVLLRMPESLLAALQPMPEVENCRPGSREMDFVQFFAESVADLKKEFPALKKSLAKDGMLWISWRKGKVDTDLTEDEVRAIALRGGLVDVKVCAVDEKWSGLKLVYRVKDR